MSTIKEKVVELLQALTPEEQQLLSRILRIEQEKLYQRQPQVREELMRAVREVIK
jgi:3-deoxy-D-arabino-heptulosonate 7-phosphate (DAHP) synthase class II